MVWSLADNTYHDRLFCMVFLSSSRQTSESILKQTVKTFHVFSSSPQIVFSSHSIVCVHTRVRTHARTRAHIHTHPPTPTVWSFKFMYVSCSMAVFSFLNFYHKLNNKFLWTALFEWYFPSMTILSKHRRKVKDWWEYIFCHDNTDCNFQEGIKIYSSPCTLNCSYAMWVSPSQIWTLKMPLLWRLSYHFTTH